VCRGAGLKNWPRLIHCDRVFCITRSRCDAGSNFVVDCSNAVNDCILRFKGTDLIAEIWPESDSVYDLTAIDTGSDW
jgi:hypothetical protein